MANLHANGIDIEYETFGDAPAEPLLLIMGFGRQMIAWPDAFCTAIADRGFRVIRFDNRDAGLTRTNGAPYTIDDMADDAAGLLTALGITAAHVVGASMGGAIAQTLAIRRPEMVLSLTSIMSTSGRFDQVGSDPDVMRLLAADPPVADRDGAIDRAVRIARAVGTQGMFDEARAREAAARAWDRDPSYDGLERQRQAMAASGDRTEALGRLSVPALVIHGEADQLVSVAAGRRTAEAIPDARLLVVPGMGHDLPQPLWDQVVDAIAEVAGRARSAV
ncbi:MAG TPA: alpha/beta hydrolase [Candidatus Angelobacter sp.]|jgi:pimeloyl-ACP methyl ester carboxylesterase|nr:alpha/beta hydrolase [Candidatus Angelobacter sp.]